MDPGELRSLLETGQTEAALDAVYRAHAEDVRRFVRARLGGRTDGEDVCQEVWAAASRMLETFSGQVPVRAWILGIARHKTVDAWRKGGGLETLDSQLREGGPLAAMMGVKAVTTPSRIVSRHRRGSSLRDALEAMRPEERELLELRFVHDLKPAEIASMLDEDVDPNTIAQRVLRATRRLREALVRAGVTGA